MNNMNKKCKVTIQNKLFEKYNNKNNFKLGNVYNMIDDFDF